TGAFGLSPIAASLPWAQSIQIDDLGDPLGSRPFVDSIRTKAPSLNPPVGVFFDGVAVFFDEVPATRPLEYMGEFMGDQITNQIIRHRGDDPRPESKPATGSRAFCHIATQAPTTYSARPTVQQFDGRRRGEEVLLEWRGSPVFQDPSPDRQRHASPGC